MTNRNISKLILIIGLVVSLAGAVILIIFHADKDYVITCFGFVTAFSSSIFPYINSGKEEIGGSGVNESSTSTETKTSTPIPKTEEPKV